MDEAANSPRGGVQTVKFNVGGRTFETARSLIDRHEGTMLARLVSDTWQDRPDEPVFVDRDGDIFAQVLNYLRYGSVSLPVTVPRDMFLRDLDFYGVEAREGSVTTYSEGWAAGVAARRKKINELKTEMEGLELLNDIDLLVHHCAEEYLKNGKTRFEYKKEMDKHLYKVAYALTRSHKDAFEESLSKFGLCVSECKRYGREERTSRRQVCSGKEYKVNFTIGLLKGDEKQECRLQTDIGI